MSSLNVSFWNIHSSKLQYVGNKLCDPEFLDILSGRDIIGLGELHAERRFQRYVCDIYTHFLVFHCRFLWQNSMLWAHFHIIITWSYTWSFDTIDNFPPLLYGLWETPKVALRVWRRECRIFNCCYSNSFSCDWGTANQERAIDLKSLMYLFRCSVVLGLVNLRFV